MNFSDYVKEQVSNFEFDYLHLNSPLGAFIDNKTIDKKKVILAIHENPLEFDHYWGKGAYKRFLKILKSQKKMKQLFKGYKAYITFTEKYKKQYNKDFGINIKKIGHSININRLKMQKVKKKKFLRILVPARLDIHQKGLDIAINAASYLKQKEFAFKMTISGLNKKTYYKNYLILLKKIKKYNLEKSVKIKKFTNMGQAYSTNDIILLPSRYESFGLAALEALLAGRPAVLTKIPAFVELANSCPNAHLVNKNPKLIGEKIIDISKDLNIDKTKYKRFKEKNSLKNWAKKYQEIYYHK